MDDARVKPTRWRRRDLARRRPRGSCTKIPAPYLVGSFGSLTHCGRHSQPFGSAGRLGSSITRYGGPVGKGSPRGTPRGPPGLRIIHTFRVPCNNPRIDAVTPTP